MATVGDIAQRSLKRILVQGANAPLEADEYSDYIDSLNDYMAALESDGVRLGYTTVDNISDVVTVPDGALRGIIANVAIEVSPDYGGSISEALVRQAREGLKTLRKIGSKVIASGYPDTLPMGSGTEEWRYTAHYFDSVASALVSLSGNADATAMTVTNTAARVSGFWSVIRSEKIRADITGRLTLMADESADVIAKVAFSATGNSTYTFRLMQNGVSQEVVSSALTGTPTALTISKLVTLAPGDYLELWVEDDLATESVTVTQAQFEVV
jgi:hypothetical protein